MPARIAAAPDSLRRLRGGARHPRRPAQGGPPGGRAGLRRSPPLGWPLPLPAPAVDPRRSRRGRPTNLRPTAGAAGDRRPLGALAALPRRCGRRSLRRARPAGAGARLRRRTSRCARGAPRGAGGGAGAARGGRGPAARAGAGAADRRLLASPRAAGQDGARAAPRGEAGRRGRLEREVALRRPSAAAEVLLAGCHAEAGRAARAGGVAAAEGGGAGAGGR